MPSPDYELLDFGDGRKLERFGPNVVDRPCPTAEGIPRARPEVWSHVAGKYDRASGGPMEWSPPPDEWPELAWFFRQSEPFRLELALAPLPSGQVGMFPEQAKNWTWIHEQVRAAGALDRGIGFQPVDPLRVLNLFAYTGASTIAAAAAGAEVTHVDAADSAVARASASAAASGLADAPVRWIVDDAVKFSRRELRRGRRYDAVILDPPTYGHGKRGEVWQIQRDLPELLNLSAELTRGRPAFMLLTCHTTGFDALRLSEGLAEVGLRDCNTHIESGEMRLRTADGRELPSGVYARFSMTTALPDHHKGHQEHEEN